MNVHVMSSGQYYPLEEKMKSVMEGELKVIVSEEK